MRPFLRMLIIAAGAASFLASGADKRQITFEERVRAQEAIERVYYSHQIGTTKPFEHAVTKEVLDKKVRTYLRQSLAMERIWNVPVTAVALEEELDRIVTSTRLPGRLEEVFDALGNDPVLIQECFVRPVLVDRLARRLFAGDDRFNRSPGRSFSAWWSTVEDSLDETFVGTVAGQVDVGAAAARCLPEDTWAGDHLGDDPDARYGHVAVWTGSEMLAWGGFGPESYSRSGTRYDPAADAWQPMSTLGAPGGRYGHTAVWTGSEMLVWGGYDGSGTPDTGGRYDPATDTWSSMTTTNAPIGRTGQSAVWTGTSMIVWGGSDSNGTLLNSGGRYDPTGDTWTPTTTVDAPSVRGLHQAVWTGSRMIVWGGGANAGPGSYLDTGGRYDPATDAWTPTSTVNAPAPRQWFAAVWTGNEMVVWGGEDDHLNLLDNGGRYDPDTDAWTPTSTLGAPEPRSFPGVVWTGSRMIVWGGAGGSSGTTNTGGRYDPATDTWSPTSTLNAPAARLSHSMVWTGSLMIAWGGDADIGTLGSGGRYDPSTDTWTPTWTVPAPSQRRWHAAVWTGNLMIVWGGIDGISQYVNHVNTGGRYDPLTNTWTPTSTLDAPAPRRLASGVWTGSHMIVWGGSGSSYLDSGGRYDPIADTWTPTSLVSAPAGREWHTAVWTGSRMIVWGGYGAGGIDLNTGGRYDPATDTWSPTSIVNAPTERRLSTSVWTGNEMIVWGGSHLNSYLNTGGRYNPLTDVWMPTSTTDAPSPRRLTSSVWTGREMLVWGGFSDVNHGDSLDSGGRYDPATDTWAAISSAGRPAAREHHTSLWTGTVMVVWGGQNFTQEPDPSVGGRYDPATDAWQLTSSINAPPGRSFHSAVWTGDEMIVWGGESGGSSMNTGGRYSLGRDSDDDADGYSVCAGDCDDGDVSVHPGAVDLPGNAVDEDCSGSAACDATGSWRNRGSYVRCVVRECESLVGAGLVSDEVCRQVLRTAARSRIGNHLRRQWAPPAEP